jgi:hypothetical protein
MTSFIHTDFPTTHDGLNRVTSAFAAAQAIGRRFRGAKGLVALLLAGVFSALVVVADQVVSSWADGQVVIAWMALWVVLFGAILLFTEASRGWADSIVALIENWSKVRAQRAEDENTWRFAQSDSRFMAELQVARCRAEEQARAAGEPAPAWPFRHMPMQAAAPRRFM